MSMPATNSTPHYQLPIYQANDHFSVLGDLNSAMNTIDSELAVAASSVDGAAANASAALTAATAAEAKAEEAKTSATAASVSAQQAAQTAASASTLANTAVTESGEAKTLATTARDTAQLAASQASTAASDASNAVTAAASAQSLATQAVDEQQFLRTASLENDMAIPSGDRVTDVVALTLTGLTVGRVYTISSMMEMHVPSGVKNDKSMQVLLDTNPIYEEVYNDDEFRVTLFCAVPFKATSTSHVVTMKCNSAATGTFDILSAGTRLYVW